MVPYYTKARVQFSRLKEMDFSFHAYRFPILYSWGTFSIAFPRRVESERKWADDVTCKKEAELLGKPSFS